MKPAKQRIMWTIVDADGDICFWTISSNRKNSIRIFEFRLERKWAVLKEQYRCIRVNVSEVVK